MRKKLNKLRTISYRNRAELSTAPRIPGGFLVVLVPYQDSWWIPGIFLVLYQDSWYIPGTFLPGFLVHSWYIPGTSYQNSWCILVHSWYIPGIFLVHSWYIPGAFLVYSWYLLPGFLDSDDSCCTVIFQFIWLLW